jgi:hypothetical protein
MMTTMLSYNIIPIDPIATADANYLTDRCKDLVILEIKPQEIALMVALLLPPFTLPLFFMISNYTLPSIRLQSDLSPLTRNALLQKESDTYYMFHLENTIMTFTAFYVFWCPKIPSCCIISPHSFELLAT